MRIITATLLAALFLQSCTSDTCSNEILDGEETEIDCGGECQDCPSQGTAFATVEGVPFYAATVYVEAVSGNYTDFHASGSGTTINFQFYGLEKNTFLPITGGNLTADAGAIHYSMTYTDTGSVFITHYDELRKIISGRFFFNATGNQPGSITDGVFENVRYE